MKIVADPNILCVREAFAPLGDLQLIPGRKLDSPAVRDAEVLLVRSVTPVNPHLLEGSRVRFVASATIGTDHIDLEYLQRRGIGFASAAGSNANSVAEYVVAALLELAGRRHFRLRDQVLGIIGVGQVGRLVLRYAEALGMRVLPNDPPRQRVEKLPDFVPLERIWEEANLITLHVPLTERGCDATLHLLNRKTLRCLVKKPLLINTARGAVVENPALDEALRSGEAGGAVLDVWEHEPTVRRSLLELVDLGTPHIAGYSVEGKLTGTRIIYEAACRFLGREPSWNHQSMLGPPLRTGVELSVPGSADQEDALRSVVENCYRIAADDSAFRSRPDQFDELRAHYPPRREFSSIPVTLHSAPHDFRQMLETLGFRVL